MNTLGAINAAERIPKQQLLFLYRDIDK
jgi:hypothetical protein